MRVLLSSPVMAHSKTELSTGWTLKQHDDSSDDWLSVASVPSQVHVDLLAHNKYVGSVSDTH